MKESENELLELLYLVNAEAMHVSKYLDGHPEANSEEVQEWKIMFEELLQKLENNYNELKTNSSFINLKESYPIPFRDIDKSLDNAKKILDRAKEFLDNFNITTEKNVCEVNLDLVRYRLRFKYRDPESGSVKKVDQYIYIDNTMSTALIQYQIIQTIKTSLNSFGESSYDDIVVDDSTRAISVLPKTLNYIYALMIQMYYKKYNKKIKVNLTFKTDPNKIIKLSICSKPDNNMKLGMV